MPVLPGRRYGASAASFTKRSTESAPSLAVAGGWRRGLRSHRRVGDLVLQRGKEPKGCAEFILRGRTSRGSKGGCERQGGGPDEVAEGLERVHASIR